MVFTKAVKTKQWLRLAIDGISGSGKTYTALSTASGMAEAMKGKIALIDSEHGSASLYADRFEFDTLELMEFQIENYIEALEAAAKAGYDIVIIDSTSHAWDALVERVERTAHQRFSGNTFRAWAEGTPLQKKFVEAMLTYPGHLIVTCRSKTEYSVDKDDKNKTTIKKLGTAAVQRQGFEYEFTMAMTMDGNHVGLVTKDRTGKFQDKFIEKPGKAFGKQLIDWLNEGKVAPPPVKPTPPSEQKKPKSIDEQRKEGLEEIGKILKATDEFGVSIFSEKEIDDVRATIRTELAEIQQPEQKLEYINKVLNEQKELLHKRLEAPPAKPEPASEPKSEPPQDTAPDNTKPSEPNTAPAQENAAAEQVTENVPADDGFTDDIPWDDNAPPKPKGKKGKAASGDELDIY